MNIYPPEKQGSAMAVWSLVVVAGPAIGAAVGGWLTFTYSWRHVFFVNVPVGAACFAGLLIFTGAHREKCCAEAAWLGFAALSLAIGGLQLLLDRGQEKDWFNHRNQH